MASDPQSTPASFEADPDDTACLLLTREEFEVKLEICKYSHTATPQATPIAYIYFSGDRLDWLINRLIALRDEAAHAR
jgi:hypothetical protein